MLITQHRSRRARAIQRQRLDSAQAVDDLNFADDEEPPAVLVTHESLAVHFVSNALQREKWSVLEAAGAIAALAMADAERLDMLFGGYQSPIEADESLPVLVAAGHPGAPRARDKRGRAAFARKLGGVEDLV
jgi:hypothetical protein